MKIKLEPTYAITPVFTTEGKELFNIFDNNLKKIINEDNRVFYFFDKEIANSISKDGRRLMKGINLKNEGNDT